MKIAIKCFHCQSDKVEYKFQIERYPLYQCMECEIAFLHPQPTSEQLADIYNEDYILGGQTVEGETRVSQMKGATAKLYLQELLVLCVALIVRSIMT